MEKIIKIFVILPVLGYGGAERVVLRALSKFSYEKFEVYGIFILKDSSHAGHIKHYPHIKPFILYRNNYFSLIKKIIKLAKKISPDVIWAHDINMAILAVTSKYLGNIKYKIVVTVHATLSKRWEEYNQIRRMITRIISSIIFKKVDYIVAISSGAMRDLLIIDKNNKKKAFLIRNAVITDEIFMLAQKECTVPSNKYILAAGRLVKQKGFDVLIEAYNYLRNKYNKNIMLLILGDGPEKIFLKKKVKEYGLESSIIIQGHVENPFPYLKKAEVFVLSSRWEGLPTVLIEALALGVTIVSTDCPSGPREILENGRWGYLVPPGDHIALAEAMNLALSNKVINIPREVWQPYLAEVAANNYRELFKKVCS